MKKLLEWRVALQDSFNFFKNEFPKKLSPLYTCSKTKQTLYLREGMEIFTIEYHLPKKMRKLGLVKILRDKRLIAIKEKRGHIKTWKIETRIIGRLCNCCQGTKVLVMVDKNKNEKIINELTFPRLIFTSV